MSIISQNQATSAYPRLEFDDFDAPAPASALAPAPGPDDASATAPAADGALEIAPGITLPTLEDLERIASEAQKEGYSAGYEEGFAQAREEAVALSALASSLDEALKGLEEQVGEEIQALAIEIARCVVRDTLAIKPETIQLVVREALQRLPQQNATIYANPADVHLLRRGLENQLEGVSHRIVERDDIQRGGCIVEAAGAQIDARLETRWRRVVESLNPGAAEYPKE